MASDQPAASILIGTTTVRAVHGDITKMDVDVVVNAANEHLAHGGGVAAAISRAGGPIVDEESARWVAEHGPVARGESAVTSGGDMEADHIVHVVGPIYRGEPSDEDDLRAAVRAALSAADAAAGRSVAIPAISAGIYGYPTAPATRIIVEQTVDWLSNTETRLEEVLLVGFNERTHEGFTTAIEAMAG